MARAKKEAALTPEERLQAALVPDWEWPYKLPENWCWVYAPHIFDIEYGKGLPTKQLSDTGYPVFGANGQINVPSISEQEKVVAVIQKLLSKEQQSKKAAEAVLNQIDLMKKSILVRAFRGELGANDPSEESAVELLKRILESKKPLLHEVDEMKINYIYIDGYKKP